MSTTDSFADDLAAALARAREDKRLGFALLYPLCLPRVLSSLRQFHLPTDTWEDSLADT